MTVPIIKTVAEALNEFGVPFKIKGNSLYILAELDPESINENSAFYTVKYMAKNSTEIEFSYDLHGGSVLLILKSKDGKRKPLLLGVNVYFSLQDDRIILKRVEY